tara:strand:- start:6876 stop:7304 length:429 start_codon:yes stop_codon:yes gene_type:complete
MNSIIDASNKDWDIFIKENNISKKDVDFYLNNILDTPEFDKAAGKVVNINNNIYYKEKSNIHGYGIFAKKNIAKDEVIGKVLYIDNNNEKCRSYLGRYINHSNVKNAIFKEINNNFIMCVCCEDINKDQEILVDYRDHFLKM